MPFDWETGAVEFVFDPGQTVTFAGEFTGTVEEAILQRNTHEPVYLVEYWHEGERRTARFWETELELADA